MSNKPLKAYIVTAGSDDGHWVVGFSTNGAAARRKGASDLGVSFEEVESCQRAPQFDRYAPGPVPFHAMLDAGWWFECHHCGVMFNLDERLNEHDDRDDEFQPIESPKTHYYCSPTCMMEGWAERRERMARQCAAIEAALICWPMATSVNAFERRKAWPNPETQWYAQFLLPGVCYPVQWAPGELAVTVAQLDVEAFKRLYGGSSE